MKEFIEQLKDTLTGRAKSQQKLRQKKAKTKLGRLFQAWQTAGAHLALPLQIAGFAASLALVVSTGSALSIGMSVTYGGMLAIQFLPKVFGL